MPKLRLGADGHACQGHMVDMTLTWASEPGGLTPEQEFLILSTKERKGAWWGAWGRHFHDCGC